jgi:hypothetical protein
MKLKIELKDSKTLRSTQMLELDNMVTKNSMTSGKESSEMIFQNTILMANLIETQTSSLNRKLMSMRLNTIQTTTLLFSVSVTKQGVEFRPCKRK